MTGMQVLFSFYAQIHGGVVSILHLLLGTIPPILLFTRLSTMAAHTLRSDFKIDLSLFLSSPCMISPFNQAIILPQYALNPKTVQIGDVHVGCGQLIFLNLGAWYWRFLHFCKLLLDESLSHEEIMGLREKFSNTRTLAKLEIRQLMELLSNQRHGWCWQTQGDRVRQVTQPPITKAS